MAGDNNLGGAGKKDLDEMQKVGSDSKINIVVQLNAENNKTTRFLVEKNNLKVLQEMSRVNYSDPKTLTDFIKWGTKNYPANYYLVNVWNHGEGWENLPADYNWENIRASNPLKQSKIRRFKSVLFFKTIRKVHGAPAPERLIAMDVASDLRKVISETEELRKAISDGLPIGKKLDILGCDACLMNTLEICYENKDIADYMISSEDTETGNGWPYAMILNKLASKPEMSPRELSIVIIQEHEKHYESEGDNITDQGATQSAIDLGQIKLVADSVNKLAELLMKNLNNYIAALIAAKEKSQKFTTQEYIDFLSFLQQLIKWFPNNDEIKSVAKEILGKLEGMTGSLIIANAKSGESVKDANGLSIYFPNSDNYSPDYSDLLFSKEGKWNELLIKIFSG
jgi:hypothetical protein